MKKAIFPGTFTYFHSGHINILKRGLKLFDEIYVLVAINPDKNSLDLDDRYNNAIQTIKSLNLRNVYVHKTSDMVVNFAKNQNIKFIIRGIRDSKDFFWEDKIGRAYKDGWNEIEIVYLFSEESLKTVSSFNLKKKESNNYEE